MMSKWSTRGAIAPLFDRLSDFEPEIQEEASPFRLYDERDLRLSIQRECTRILNTRCTLTKKEYEALEPEAMEFPFPRFFGLPDTSIENPKDSLDAHRIIKTMAKAIEIFEPRLHNVRVAIKKYEEPRQVLYLTVEGDVTIGEIVKSVSFPVALQDFQEQGDRENKIYTLRPSIELPNE